jgi:hypothetical protein
MAEQPFDRDSMAKWYAQRHLKTDDAIEEVRYLPQGAPDREIRLLEINKLVSETTPMEPIDYGVGIDGAEAHTLYVLDVTPRQWQEIRHGRLQLPRGWTLDKSVAYGREG